MEHQFQLSSISDAMAIWAQGAGYAGARLPRLILRFVNEGKSLLQAIESASIEAMEEHTAEGGGYNTPRGLDITIDPGGYTKLSWRTERHLIAIWGRAEWWNVDFDGPEGSERLAAMTATASQFKKR